MFSVKNFSKHSINNRVKKHLHDKKKWIISVLSTIKPNDEIYEKDYLPPEKTK